MVSISPKTLTSNCRRIHLDRCGLEWAVGAVAGVVDQHVDAVEAFLGGSTAWRMESVEQVEAVDDDARVFGEVGAIVGVAHGGDNVPVAVGEVVDGRSSDT